MMASISVGGLGGTTDPKQMHSVQACGVSNRAASLSRNRFLIDKTKNDNALSSHELTAGSMHY